MINISFYSDESLHTTTCTKIGSDHIKYSVPNQDCVQFGKIEDDSFFLAVADGVSAAKKSKEGSTAAVTTIRELLNDIHNKKIEIDDIGEIRKYIVREWKNKFTSDWNEYATTLNFILVFGKNVIVGQIGDGLIALKIDGFDYLYTNNTDFYSSETFALGEVVLKRTFSIEKFSYKECVNVVMVTDGIGKEIDLGSVQELRQYLIKLVAQGENQVTKELTAWFDVLEKKNGDDKSLGILSLEV